MAERLVVADANQEVYLLQVPAFLAEAWQGTAQGEEVGVLKIPQGAQNGKGELRLAAQQVMREGGAVPIPERLNVSCKRTRDRGLQVVSQETKPVPGARDGRSAGLSGGTARGVVGSRMEAQPVPGDRSYEELMRRRKVPKAAKAGVMGGASDKKLPGNALAKGGKNLPQWHGNGNAGGMDAFGGTGAASSSLASRLTEGPKKKKEQNKRFRAKPAQVKQMLFQVFTDMPPPDHKVRRVARAVSFARVLATFCDELDDALPCLPAAAATPPLGRALSC